MRTMFIINYDFYGNRNHECSRKNSKIAFTILQKHSDDEKCLQKAQKQADLKF